MDDYLKIEKIGEGKLNLFCVCVIFLQYLRCIQALADYFSLAPLSQCAEFVSRQNMRLHKSSW